MGSVLHILSSGTVGGIEVLCEEYARYSNNRNIFVFLWNKGIICDEMSNEGTVAIPLNASKRDFIGPFLHLCSICKDYQVKTVVVHHSAPIAHLYLMMLKIKYPYLKTVGYAHSHAHDMCPAEKKFLWIRKKIISQSLKKATKVIAISNLVKDSCVSYFGTPKDKIEIVYNGVDIDRFTPIFTHQRIEKIFKLIYVGRLIEPKGVQNTLKALTLLPQKIKYEFKIVGDGPYRNQLETFAKDKNLSNVHFLGERRDIPELLQAAEYFVHVPEWEEGFGITIVEAMATGLICVCRGIGAIPEIIAAGKNGFLVSDDPYQIANSLTAIFNKTEEEKRMIKENARKRALDFSIQKFSNQLDTILQPEE
ncbi:glycosyltransferase family 4 protein [Bifidobacterium pullorum subsp. saeculare]|uniref:glycosyltransferase family 4 protein n=1 Tax=Bifidobacterium pullorum TaxID=78448 RepID=UPI00195B0D37|nr:glycosyltransferase family 4 protein [Bifidobacterium pullorum]MBM6693102.1 glycosyltransferase family 4 protein [Bifidobacterium pullorum subsp. saeculare]